MKALFFGLSVANADGKGLLLRIALLRIIIYVPESFPEGISLFPIATEEV